MSTPIVRRRKRPVEVDTIQWLGDNIDDVIAFTGVGHFQVVGDDDRNEDPDITAVVWDRLHSTWVGVRTGQHIVRGIRGEFYPIAEDVLADTYDTVDEAFFQPGHTYTRGKHWRFACLAVAPTPWDGTLRATGFLTRDDGTGCVHGMTADQWAAGDWTDITDTTTGDNL